MEATLSNSLVCQLVEWRNPIEGEGRSIPKIVLIEAGLILMVPILATIETLFFTIVAIPCGLVACISTRPFNWAVGHAGSALFALRWTGSLVIDVCAKRQEAMPTTEREARAAFVEKHSNTWFSQIKEDKVLTLTKEQFWPAILQEISESTRGGLAEGDQDLTPAFLTRMVFQFAHGKLKECELNAPMHQSLREAIEQLRGQSQVENSDADADAAWIATGWMEENATNALSERLAACYLIANALYTNQDEGVVFLRALMQAAGE